METNTEDQLTLFAGDSLVNHFPLQENSKAKKMTVTSGLKCYELSKNQNHLGLLVKMFLVSSKWHSTTCALTWKLKVTESNRLLYRLVPSMPRTKEIVAGLWPTPTAMTGGTAVAPSHRTGKHGWNLGAAVTDSLSQNPVRVWPTMTTDSQDQTSGKLNPEWVEWLMGFPIGWTELNHSETQ